MPFGGFEKIPVFGLVVDESDILKPNGKVKAKLKISFCGSINSTSRTPLDSIRDIKRAGMILNIHTKMITTAGGCLAPTVLLT